MKIDVLTDAGAVALKAATIIASEARSTVAARGKFILAVSGGHTPWLMLRALAKQEMPWPSVHLVQVDERVAPAGHADRNLTHLYESLLKHVPIRFQQIVLGAFAAGCQAHTVRLHAMPVDAVDLEAAAAGYAATLNAIAGFPPVLDLVHLGLGPDGHTASLVPGDSVLDAVDEDVALTGVYQGRRRMTLTYPLINRARRILWVVAGPEKVTMLGRLLDGDMSIPAGRVRRDHALVLADSAAAGNSAERKDGV